VPIWFGLIFGGVGIVAMVLTFAGYLNAARLAEEGVRARGTVVQLYTTPGEHGDEYWVGYTFTDPGSGRSYRDSSPVSRTAYDATRLGDPIDVTYLPSDPGSHVAGKPDANPMVLLMAEGIGLLFAAVGAVLVWTSIRARRAGARATAGRPAAAETPGAGTPADASTTAAELARVRVDVFTRSRMRVLYTALAPFIGLGSIVVGGWSLTHAADLEWLFFGGLAAFLGSLFLLIGVNQVSKGLGRRMLEVGPDGIWLRGLGRLPWSDVGEVRLEEAHRVPAVAVAGAEADGRRTGEGTVTRVVDPTYTRVGIVPGDPELASRDPWGLLGTVTAAMRGAVASMRPAADGPDPVAPAPYGIASYEIEQPLEQVVASLRRFIPTESIAAAGATVPAVRGASLTLAPSFVPVAPGGPSVPAVARYRQRRGWLLGGTRVQVDGGGIGAALATAAIGTIVDAVRDHEPGPDVLSVGPDGLSIPGVVDLPWDGIDAIDVEERTMNEAPDNILRVVPGDRGLIETRQPPRASAWKVGRLGGSWLSGGSPAYVIHLNAIDAPADDVLDVIAQYHVVDEGS
jgi:hypothetical protein